MEQMSKGEQGWSVDWRFVAARFGKSRVAKPVSILESKSLELDTLESCEIVNSMENNDKDQEATTYHDDFFSTRITIFLRIVFVSGFHSNFLERFGVCGEIGV